MKVTVLIHTPHGLEFKTCKVTQKGNIILRKRKGNDPGWKVELRNPEVKHLRFGRSKFYAEIWPEDKATTMFDTVNKTVTRTEMTNEDVIKLAKSKVFEKRYNTEPKAPGGILLYIMFGVMVVGFIALALISTGRLRI